MVRAVMMYFSMNVKLVFHLIKVLNSSMKKDSDMSVFKRHIKCDSVVMLKYKCCVRSE